MNIENASREIIHSIELAYTEGVKQCKSLEPNKNITFNIIPRGESHLEIKFMDSSGNMHFKNIDVYFERNYNGYVNVKIDEANGVIWEDHIKSR